MIEGQPYISGCPFIIPNSRSDGWAARKILHDTFKETLLTFQCIFLTHYSLALYSIKAYYLYRDYNLYSGRYNIQGGKRSEYLFNHREHSGFACYYRTSYLDAEKTFLIY